MQSLVQMKDLRLINLKPHDYHTLMQQLLHIAFRGVLLKGVRNAVTQMCYFYNALCNKVIDSSTLSQLQNNLFETLCSFEKYFPLSFFNMMIYITMHMLREIRLCGPLSSRWMYGIKRYMKVLKGM